jgi:hypothetical protein
MKPLLTDVNSGEVVYDRNGVFSPESFRFPYDKIKQTINKQSQQEDDELDKQFFHWPNAYFIPPIGKEDWDGHIFISGATGAGKTYFVNRLLTNDPLQRKIFLFTDFNEKDESLDGLYATGRMKRVVRSQKQSEKNTTILPDELEKALQNKRRPLILVFDDCSDKEFVIFRDHALKKGRHSNRMVVCIEHKMRDWNATKVPMTECRYFVVFPAASTTQINGFLKDLMEVNAKVRNALTQLAKNDGRHAIIHMHAPNFFASAKSIVKM